MPWKECQKMDEKLRFVSHHLEWRVNFSALPGVWNLPRHGP